ncbi:ricin B-like lectin R40C1 [Carex rostrata]
MGNEPTLFTIINKADEDYCLAIHGRKVVIAQSIPHDPYQQWFRKDTATMDEEGQHAFVLVNKATNEAIMHNGTSGPMSLVPYDVASQDKSVLFTESKKDDQSFRYIRRASVIAYHMTANNHEIQDGRIIDLSTGTHISEWWKFTYNNKDQLGVTISCRSKEGYNLTIRDDTVMLAPADSKDKYQAWIKDISYGNQVKDEDNRRSFALVNKATGKAIKHGFGPGYLVQLAPFNPNYLDVSLLWTEDSKDLGFQQIRMQTNKSVVFHAFYVHQPDSNKALLALRPKSDSYDQHWKYQEIV